MRIDIPTNFVKAGINIKDGDIVKLLDEGKWDTMTGQDGKTKQVLKFEMKLADGETKTYTMNNTTIRNLTQEWGQDSKDWMRKELKVHLLAQMAFGKMIKVLILTPPDWKEATMEESNLPEEEIPILEDLADEE